MPTNRPANSLRADSIAASFGVSAVATVVVRGTSLARGVILAWLMSPAEFGLLGVALLVANVLMPIAGAGLHESIARYAPVHEAEGTLRRFARRSLTTAMVTACLFAAGFLLLAPVLAPLLLSAARETPGQSPRIGLMRIVLLCVVTLVPYHATLALLRGLRIFRGVAAVDVTATLAFTVFAVGCALMGWGSADYVMGAYALANVAGLGALLIFIRSRSLRSDRATPVVTVGLSPAPLVGTGQPVDPSCPPADRREDTPAVTEGPGRRRPVLRPLFAYGVWAAGTASVWQLLWYYPTWHLLRVTDESVVGAFYAVRMITQLVQIAGAMGVAVVSAHVTRVWEAEGPARALPLLETLTKAGMVVLILMAAVLAVAEPMVMRVLPPRLASGAMGYHPMLGFFLLFSITGLWAVRLTLIERPRLVFFAWLAGAAVGVAVCFGSLGSPFGAGRADPLDALSAAAWALTAGGATAALVLLMTLVRAGTTPGRASIVLCVLCSAVPLGRWPALACGLLVLATALLTPLILSPAERHALRDMLPKRRGRSRRRGTGIE